jgi:hypothetical protein
MQWHPTIRTIARQAGAARPVVAGAPLSVADRTRRPCFAEAERPASSSSLRRPAQRGPLRVQEVR